MRRFSIFNLQSSICLLVFFTLSLSIMAQDVYVGGSAGSKAALWKNGELIHLSTGDGIIFSVVVDKGNVYAAGFENETAIGPAISKVWKNGVELYAIGSGEYAWGHSVAVSENGDVYMTERSGNVWKNGISEPGYEDLWDVGSVFTDGDDVYVVGTINGYPNPTQAIVMKNGEQFLTINADAYNYFGKSGVVVGDDVYVAVYGCETYGNWMPKVYKNNTLLYALESTGTAFGVGYDCSLGLHVSGDDVYVAGHEEVPGNTFSTIAKLWTNDVATNLTEGGWDIAFSVSKFGNDVYVAGESNGVGILWMNGEPIMFGQTARCVFVTPSDVPPTIITESLPDGTIGTPYSATLEADSDIPVTWSIESGSLPEGLSLDAATGEISGTSTETDISEFIIKATSASGSDIKVLTIVIHLAPTITITSLPDGLTGAQYFATLKADSETPITWSIENGNLPIGLSLNATTGVIDGLPVEVGIFDFTIHATNTAGGSASKELSIIIEFGISIGELQVTSNELQVFPNPTDGVLTIEMGDTGNEICDITIYDVYGRKCHMSRVTCHENNIDISDLPAGVYFVKINTEAGEVMIKVVKK